MYNTLIIYDNTGQIFLQMSGSYRKPEGGIQFLEVDSAVHQNKIIKSVNPQTKELILEDIPKTEVALLQEQLLSTQSLVADLQEQLLLK